LGRSGSNEHWEKYGKLDPYFGVFSHAQFQTPHLSQAALDEFFASGAEHLTAIVDIVRHHLRPDFQPRTSLDYGCGVGRITVPLARLCARVVGVDVSQSMLREARRNCETRGVSNVDLIRSDDLLSVVPESFDFIHSFIVLQHIPPSKGELLIRTLIHRLAGEGVGVLQLTYYRRASPMRRVLHWMRRHVPGVHNVANLVQGRGVQYPLMDMYNYDLNRVLAILQELGCHECHVRFTDHGGHLGVVLFFVKRSLASL
jgi:SAM-dependent methyltransferase